MHVSVQTSSVVPCSIDLGLFTCGTGTPAKHELVQQNKWNILTVQRNAECVQFNCYHI